MFADRQAAGRLLAQAVARLSLPDPVLVLGLPRGGVTVAREVARALRAAMDVMVVRKIGMPGNPELVVGAVASGGIVVHEHDTAQDVDSVQFEQQLARARRELLRREQVYRGDSPALQLSGRSVVLVDDGIATGATMLAAVRAARSAGATAVVVAAPVASLDAAERLGAEADRIVILHTPVLFCSIGEWNAIFDQLNDAEVLEALSVAAAALHVAGGARHAAFLQSGLEYVAAGCRLERHDSLLAAAPGSRYTRAFGREVQRRRSAMPAWLVLRPQKYQTENCCLLSIRVAGGVLLWQGFKYQYEPAEQRIVGRKHDAKTRLHRRRRQLANLSHSPGHTVWRQH